MSLPSNIHKHPVRVKKTLVRNPEQSVPRTIRLTASKASSSSKIKEESPGSCSSVIQIEPQTAIEPTIRFDVPEMHSTLKLSKKIDEVVKPRKTKSLSDVDKTNKLAGEEKITRKVNFAYDQPVFKDLIPLVNYEGKVQQQVVIRGPTYQRDQEPLLADFLEPRKQRNYYHKPQNFMHNLIDKKPTIAATGGLVVYNLLHLNDL